MAGRANYTLFWCSVMPIPLPSDMDAFVRKLAASSSDEPLIKLLLKGTIKSKLICIFDSTLHTCIPLLQYIKKEYETKSFRGMKAATDQSFDGFIHLEDFTLELLNSEDHCRVFESLMRLVNGKPGQFILLDIQSDILDAKVVESLKYLAETCIITEGKGIYSIRHRVSGGSREQFELNCLSNGELSKFKPSETALWDSNTAPSLPASTFNLDISKEQREAKSQVLLPHMRVQMEDLRVTPRVLAEDYDDEDPDDDLEI